MRHQHQFIIEISFEQTFLLSAVKHKKVYQQERLLKPFPFKRKRR